MKNKFLLILLSLLIIYGCGNKTSDNNVVVNNERLSFEYGLDGQLVYKGKVYSGSTIEYWDAGVYSIVKRRANYNNGYLHGQWEEYYEPQKKDLASEKGDWVNGNLKEKGNYVHGKKNGEWIYYKEIDGRISKKENYLNGLAHGEWTSFWVDGTPYSIETYDNGTLVNHWVADISEVTKWFY